MNTTLKFVKLQKVKCIDASEFCEYLTLGKIYIVTDFNPSSMYGTKIIHDKGKNSWWRNSRFIPFEGTKKSEDWL